MVFLSLFHALSSLFAGDDTQQNVQLLVILLVITLAVALVSRPLRLPYTLLLVVAGLLIGFSPLLLFEGAWNMNLAHLKENWLPVLLLALPGLVLSVLVVAALLHWGLGLSWLVVLLLGAIISPTDPIAVLALLRQLGLSDRLRTIIEGESLFNDGVGAAIFTLVLAALLASSGTGAQDLSWWLIAGKALWLILGGFALGLLVGVIMARLLYFVNDYLIEMTMTLGVAYGVYLLGTVLATSGLLAVVGAGLVLGNYGRHSVMSERSRQVTEDIWEFFGYLANSFLFLLLGVQIGEHNIVAALAAIGLAIAGVVLGRAIMILLFISLHDVFAIWVQKRRLLPLLSALSRLKPLPRRWRPILLFSGLRGALSLALVLSLPATLSARTLLQNIVYGVVLVTLLGQGIGLRFLLPQWKKGEQ
jgi:CPA1 family monovalent cation:H+ antiporter